MRNKAAVNILGFITVLLWGSGFPFTRVIGGQISSYSLVFIRTFIAAVILLAIGRACGMRRPFCRKDLLWFFISGMFGFSLYFMFFNLGLETLTSATGSIITAVCPILTAIGVYRIYSEKINITGWLTIGTAFAGVLILILWNGIFAVKIGALWMFGAAVAFAGYNILSRKFSEMGYTAMEVTAWSAVFGAIQSLPFCPGAIMGILNADMAGNLAAFYLGIFPSAIAYYLWNKAIEMADRTSEVSNYLFVNPLIAAIIGFIMLREAPDMGTYIGGVVIIVSVIIFSARGSGHKQ